MREEGSSGKKSQIEHPSCSFLHPRAVLFMAQGKYSEAAEIYKETGCSIGGKVGPT